MNGVGRGQELMVWDPLIVWTWGREVAVVFCCSARDKPEGLGLEKQREWRRSVGTLPGCLWGIFLKNEEHSFTQHQYN